MAIHEQPITQIEGGFVKQIDEYSMRMVLDNLQKTQYSYPEKSTIRELASNSIDAVRERDIARKILLGEARVEDHFVKREGTEYKDSQFDPDYYNLNWLAEDPFVHIRYVEGSPLQKDKIIIQDFGVGLEGSRLEGYFKLAYSTKRLSRFGLGKYGIGAKAALSTGVPFYTVKNRYNGKESWFNVYSYQVVPIIPSIDLDTGKENPYFDLSGIRCNYKETTQYNGLEIILEVKKHHKQKYIDAVKSQLLYFDNVDFKIEAYDGRVEVVPVKANILYEDDIMILSNNVMYSKPHILINRVNYGNIDFLELELEDKNGNISIKFSPEEVEVSPSREHVLWGERTRESIKKRFQEVQRSAEVMLQKELEEEDFMKWLKACILTRNKINTETTNTLIGRLSKLVDLNDYAPVYKPDPEFTLAWKLFAGMSVRKITLKTERHGSTHKVVVERTQAGLSDLTGDIPVFIQQGNTNLMRDRYLLEDVYPQGFVTIWLNETEVVRPDPSLFETEEDAEKSYLSKKDMLFRQARAAAVELKLYDPRFDVSGFEEISDKARKAGEKVIDRWKRLNKYILSSSGIQFYDTIEVPEYYKDRHKGKILDEKGEETVSEEAEVKTKEAKESSEARRKLQGKTLLFTPRLAHSGNYLYDWHKMEIPVTDIDQWDNPEVYYSSENDSSLLHLAAAITRPYNLIYGRMRWNEDDYTLVDEAVGDVSKDFNDTLVNVRRSRLVSYEGPVEVKLIKVSKDRVKFYRDFKHIRQFFLDITKNKVITMSNKLIKWNTGRYIHERINQLAFMMNFERFDQECWSRYHELVAYMEKHYREVGDYQSQYLELEGPEYGDMINHMNKVTELQVFVAEHKDDPQAIATVVKELFGAGQEITDGCAIDMNIRATLHKLLEYSEPLHLMLNQMPILTDGSTTGNPMTEELEMEIRNFIAYKQAGH